MKSGGHTYYEIRFSNNSEWRYRCWKVGRRESRRPQWRILHSVKYSKVTSNEGSPRVKSPFRVYDWYLFFDTLDRLEGNG